MLRRFVGLVSFWSLLMVSPRGFAQVPGPLTLGLITGGPGGTYHTMGENLRQLAAHDGLTLEVYPSAGSLENAWAVFKKPGIRAGFVQGDVLAYIRNFETDPELRGIAAKLQVIFPLHLEAVHLLARRSLTTFPALAGKRVAVDEEQSGTYLTARLLFTLAGVTPAALVPLGKAAALTALRQGQVDAMLYVVGPPAKLFLEAPDMEALHLVPIREASLTAVYPTTQIATGTYPWQQTAVETLGVRAVLITYGYPEGPVCEAVGRLARRLRDGLPRLQVQGHPAWQHVDFKASVLQEWKQAPCVTRALPPSPKTNPILENLKKRVEDLAR